MHTSGSMCKGEEEALSRLQQARRPQSLGWLRGRLRPLSGQTLYSCALLHSVQPDTHSCALLHGVHSDIYS